jgi:hypothetical protein
MGGKVRSRIVFVAAGGSTFTGWFSVHSTVPVWKFGKLTLE